jgi:hypothetical protein
MDFKNFKKGRKKLNTAVNKMKDQNPKFKKDERFWTPTKDDTGSSNALIRFLPQPDPEKPPTVSFFQHGFKEKGKWFIENCPSTKENPCPVCEYIEPYWDEDTEESKNYARRYSRTKQFIANILVIKDLMKPENNGKVFLFKFGVKIYEKLEEKVFPESELDEAVQIFDMWKGCAFKLKLRQKSGRNNYDNSEFVSKTGPIADNEDGMETIYKQISDLDEFLIDEKFKAYDKLAKKFNRIMKIKGTTASKPAADDEGDELLDDFEDGPEDATKKSEDLPAEVDDTGKDDDFNFEDDAKEPATDDTKEVAATDEKTSESEPDKKKEAGDDFNFDDDDDDFNFDD